MSFAKKIGIDTHELNAMLESVLTAERRSQSGIPTQTERDRSACALRRASIPPELMKKAFGWDVEKEGY